jgi:hypothetical protein
VEAALGTASSCLPADRQQWVAARNGFLLPVRVLSRRFRTLFLGGFETAWKRGDLGHGDTDEVEQLQSRLRKKEWFVYSQPHFGGPDRVLKYLARYTHRVAISNSRLQRLEGDTVVFRSRIQPPARSLRIASRRWTFSAVSSSTFCFRALSESVPTACWRTAVAERTWRIAVLCWAPQRRSTGTVLRKFQNTFRVLVLSTYASGFCRS